MQLGVQGGMGLRSSGGAGTRRCPSVGSLRGPRGCSLCSWNPLLRPVCTSARASRGPGPGAAGGGPQEFDCSFQGGCADGLGQVTMPSSGSRGLPRAKSHPPDTPAPPPSTQWGRTLLGRVVAVFDYSRRRAGAPRGQRKGVLTRPGFLMGANGRMQARHG